MTQTGGLNEKRYASSLQTNIPLAGKTSKRKWGGRPGPWARRIAGGHRSRLGELAEEKTL